MITVKELKDTIDAILLNKRVEPDSPVLITLAEKSIGPTASCSVCSASVGFDWEHGQFRLEPSKSLVTKENTHTALLKCEVIEDVHIYWCGHCVHKVNKNDCYCKVCGRKLV